MKKVLIRGAGDIATGVAIRLFRVGLNVLLTDIKNPSAIRRSVSFCEAMYNEKTEVEGVVCQRVQDVKNIDFHDKMGVFLIEDEKNEIYKVFKPDIVVDAIIAKKNLGTHIKMASCVIAIGPGFCAKKDCHFVIESMRGHDLGRVIDEGFALPNTGIAGEIGGFCEERVIYAKNSGKFKAKAKIGDIVKKNDTIAFIGDEAVKASIDGVLRGIIKDEFLVTKNLKIADIDPRIDEVKNCFSVSDKARSIGGGVLEAILRKEKEWKV